MLENGYYHIDKSLFSEPVRYGSVDMIQIGRYYCSKGYIVPKHIHLNWFELTVVTGGEGIIITNGISVPVKRGDIYLSFPCDSHEIISDEKNSLKYDYISFWQHDKEISSGFEKIISECYDAKKRIIRDERIEALLANAIAEINSEKHSAYKTELINSILSQITIYTVRGFLENGVGNSDLTPTNAEAFCYQIMNYIDTHIHSMKNLEELSSVTGYNYSYLSALFKKTTSNTLIKYFSDKRLEISKIMLREKDISITEIAELLNYSSRFTFSKAFKNKYGISPASYRGNKE